MLETNSFVNEKTQQHTAIPDIELHVGRLSPLSFQADRYTHLTPRVYCPMLWVMRTSGFRFTRAILEEIGSVVKAKPSISRRELSRRLCLAHGWRSANGSLRDMACRKALADLERREVVALPAVKAPFSFQEAVDLGEVEVPEVSCGLEDLGQVVVRPVSSRYARESLVWRSLLDSHHYLGSGPLCGAQIRYLVESATYGHIGALAFTSASFALAARDRYIGWTEAARRANLPKVVCNARLLIAPSVRVKNLASRVLSLALARLPSDWEARYGVRPVLVETFVDPDRFAGTCYQAANWECVGNTSGRRDGVPKRIYVRPLCADWREVLCDAPALELGEMPRVEEPAHWAEEEFGTVRLYDNRLKQRLYVLAQSFYNSPTANIPEACGSSAATVAAYRFFRNKAISMDVILTPHTETTVERIKEHPVVLAPQDTTILDYTAHPMTEGLGPTNGKRDNSIGLILHDTLAFTQDGTPLGILDAQCWARDPQDRGKRYRRKETPIEQKESMKWLRSFRKIAEVQRLCPDTRLVSMSDRESDIYELLQEATKDPDGPGLLIRAEKSRQRQVEHGYLWDDMASAEVADQLQVHIPRRGNQKARDTWVDVRFAQVELLPPKDYSSHPPIQAWAVYVLEKPNDEPVTPVEWMLLTTVPVDTFQDARTRVEWYCGRWGIEVFHRTLKSGCRIKARQLGTSDRLEACLAVDMVVAWRIHHLTMLGRETPDAPCTAFFTDLEWQALYCYVHKTPDPPDEPPTMTEAVRMVGQMGGHMGRKRDGPPGTQTLWRGLQRLETATETMSIFTNGGRSLRRRSPATRGP